MKIRSMRLMSSALQAARIAAAGALVLAGIQAAGASEHLEVSAAWVRHAPPNVLHHAGYFVLKNDGPDVRYLASAESPDYERVEIHASRIVDGVATMEPVAAVEAAPGQTIDFAPGGLHLMLIGPKRALHLGDNVTITLAFSDGTRLTTSAAVSKGETTSKGHEHGHHHGH